MEARQSQLGDCAWAGLPPLDAPLEPVHPARLTDDQIDALQSRESWRGPSDPTLRALFRDFECIYGRPL